MASTKIVQYVIKYKRNNDQNLQHLDLTRALTVPAIRHGRKSGIREEIILNGVRMGGRATIKVNLILTQRLAQVSFQWSAGTYSEHTLNIL